MLLPLAAVGAVAASGVLVGGFLVAGQATGSTLDEWLAGRLGLSPTSTRAAYAASVWIGTSADPLPSAALVVGLALVCLLARRPRLAVLAALAPPAADLVVIVLKHLVGRTIHGEGNLSYPSTHTAQGTALAMLAALLVTSLLRTHARTAVMVVLAAAGTAALAMGWALVAGSVHYATDTLAGAAIALAVVPGAAWVVDRAADRLAATRDRAAGLPADPV